MITHRPSLAPRSLRRAAPVAAAVTALSLGAQALSPALADTPAAWPTQPHVSGWNYLVLLLLIPLGVFVLIWLAVTVPDFRRRQASVGEESWGERREWFGGPRRSVDAADEVSPEELEGSEQRTGGASGRW